MSKHQQIMCNFGLFNSKLQFEFDDDEPLSPETEGWIQSPTLADKIHCVVFVVDGSTIDVMSEKVLARINRLQEIMNEKGNKFHSKYKS